MTTKPISAACLAVLSLSTFAAGPPQTVPVPRPAVPPENCNLFGNPWHAGTRLHYEVQWGNQTQGLITMEVESLAAGSARLLLSATLGEEQFAWMTVVDCGSGVILEQQYPTLAFAMGPFPGAMIGQRLDGSSPAHLRAAISGRPGDREQIYEFEYATTAKGNTRSVERFARSTGHAIDYVLDADGPVSAVSSTGPSLQRVSVDQAAAIATLGSAPESVPAPMNATAVLGTADYSYLCGSNLTYDGHWPELNFINVSATVNTDTDLSSEDMTLLHDDRDSEFNVDPGSTFAQTYYAVNQTQMNVEWESVMLYPMHGPFGSNYPDPPPLFGGNHFLTARNVAFQGPRSGDSIVIRGALIVDCGHPGKNVEIHPPVALAWSHKFGPAGNQTPGIADYYLRASSYGWYPHVQSFLGNNNALGAFEADLDIPDATSADPGSTPYLSAITVDYTYSGYNVSDDVHTIDVYSGSHPMAHLFGGDWTQPLSNYFDVSVTLNGTKVHIHAAPKSPWDIPQTNPQRPALIGIHFMACVPIHNPAGNDLNGCVGGGKMEPPYEYRGEVRPALWNGTVRGWFYDRHRPTEAFNIRLGAEASCDLRTIEGVLGTVSETLPNHIFSYLMPPSARVCNVPSGGPIDYIVVRVVSNDERPEEEFPETFRYTATGPCVSTPDYITSGGLCPYGTGADGGYRQCAYTGSSALIPYCEPGLTGQPTLPSAPAGVTATGGANQITLSWTANNAIEYEVYSYSGTYSKIGGTFGPSYTIGSLGNGVTQSYAVSGANSIGEGPVSPVVTATTYACSQSCTSGCCSGQTCNPTPTLANGCVTGGLACGAACGPGYDICSLGCACHQAWDIACGMRMCGTVTNACGGTYNCGTCTAPYTCSGGASATCVCTPTTVCDGVSCGVLPNGCGGTYNCGCGIGDTCVGGTCVASGCGGRPCP